MEMNDLDYLMLEIFDLFNDFYADVALIVWAIKEDNLASLVEPETPIFDPLQTIGKCYDRTPLCFPSPIPSMPLSPLPPILADS